MKDALRDGGLRLLAKAATRPPSLPLALASEVGFRGRHSCPLLFHHVHMHNVSDISSPRRLHMDQQSWHAHLGTSSTHDKGARSKFPRNKLAWILAADARRRVILRIKTATCHKKQYQLYRISWNCFYIRTLWGSRVTVLITLLKGHVALRILLEAL